MYSDHPGDNHVGKMSEFKEGEQKYATNDSFFLESVFFYLQLVLLNVES